MTIPQSENFWGIVILLSGDERTRVCRNPVFVHCEVNVRPRTAPRTAHVADLLAGNYIGADFDLYGAHVTVHSLVV
jgi:hypothetical protein